MLIIKLMSVVAALVTAGALAQDAPTVLPDSYVVQFENAWVKVTRVRYGPLAKLPAHSHTSRVSAYVYLNDAGPVVFRHIGGHGSVATRPATKAGSFRVFRGLEEIHEVENTTSIPSEFLRVELKTEPTDPAAFRGKFYREVDVRGTTGEQVQFDHSQVRVSRLLLVGNHPLTTNAGRTAPSLYVALETTSFRIFGRRDSAVSLQPGATYWAEAGASERVENAGSKPAELLRFDFKTAPQQPLR